jgi:thiol-disulfide isomerase/thioredoxin
MKLFLVLPVLMILASCTQSQAPVVPAPKVEIQKEDAMIKEKMIMEADKKMKEEAMMKADAMKKDMMATGAMMEKSMSGMSDAMMKKDTMMKDEAKMMKLSGYMSYDESKVKEALASGQKVALFFHAAWCPSCRSLDTAINTNLSLIPQDALIVKVDYDTSDALKQKYGVTSQHTTVLIDKDMNLVSKKLGAKTVSDILN